MKTLAIYLMVIGLLITSGLVYFVLTMPTKSLEPIVIIQKKEGDRCATKCYTPISIDFECYEDCSGITSEEENKRIMDKLGNNNE